MDKVKKEAERRIRNYEAKVDPKVIAGRISSQRRLMVANMARYQEEIRRVEEKTGEVLREEDIPKTLVLFYFAFAHEVFSISRRYTAKTREKEIELLEEKWKARGLEGGILRKIREVIIGER